MYIFFAVLIMPGPSILTTTLVNDENGQDLTFDLSEFDFFHSLFKPSDLL